jgi:hypothetical protein
MPNKPDQISSVISIVPTFISSTILVFILSRMDNGETQNVGGVESPNGTTDNEQASQGQKPQFPTFKFLIRSESVMLIMRSTRLSWSCAASNRPESPQCWKQLRV